MHKATFLNTPCRKGRGTTASRIKSESMFRTTSKLKAKQKKIDGTTADISTLGKKGEIFYVLRAQERGEESAERRTEGTSGKIRELVSISKGELHVSCKAFNWVGEENSYSLGLMGLVSNPCGRNGRGLTTVGLLAKQRKGWKF